VDGRGYSYGYNSEIAPDGDEWEIRGQEFMAASNGCKGDVRPTCQGPSGTSCPGEALNAMIRDGSLEP
jgi:hypothetical protein